MVRDPIAPGSLARQRAAAAGMVVGGVAGGGALPLSPRSWNDAFNRAALELIALTATTAAAGRADRVSAAATDTGGGGGGGGAGGALHKIERAAIAAATSISYSPQVSLFRLA